MAVSPDKWTKRTYRFLTRDYEALRRLAEQRHRTLEGELRMAIEEYLARHAPRLPRDEERVTPIE